MSPNQPIGGRADLDRAFGRLFLDQFIGLPDALRRWTANPTLPVSTVIGYGSSRLATAWLERKSEGDAWTGDEQRWSTDFLHAVVDLGGRAESETSPYQAKCLTAMCHKVSTLA